MGNIWTKIKTAAKWIGIALAGLLTLGGYWYWRGRKAGTQAAADDAQEAQHNAHVEEQDRMAAYLRDRRAICDRYPRGQQRLLALVALNQRYASIAHKAAAASGGRKSTDRD